MTDTVRVPRTTVVRLLTVVLKGRGLAVHLAAMLAASPQGEGSSADWITHDGGPNPVPGKIVEVCFKDGCTGEPLDSECYDWTRHPDPDIAPAYDIIAYRVTEGVKRSEPDALPGDLRERVAAIIDANKYEAWTVDRANQMADAILSLIQSERGGA